MKVLRGHDRFREAGACVVIVAFDDPHLLRRTMLADIEELPFPVLVDADREAYAAWGCDRPGWWKIWLDPRVWRAYAQMLRTGQEQIRGTGRDTRQLGGDFVVGRDHRLVYSRPQRVDDRPPVGEVVRAVREAS